MKKKWARVLVWFTGGFLLLVLGFAALLYANRDRIIKSVVSETNQLLAVPVQVGDIDVSLKKFPLASLKFSNIYCQGYGSTPEDTLVFAEEMFFEFHVWKLLTQDLSIDRISLERGTLNVKIPENGPANYVIWKEDSTSKASGIFSLEKLSMNDFKFNITHEGGQLNMGGHLKTLLFSGTFESDNYQIHTSADLFLDSLLADQKTYISHTAVKGRFELSGNTDSNMIRNGQAEVNELPLAFSAEMSSENGQVEVHQKGIDIPKLRAYADAQNWQEMSENLQVKGKADLHLTVNFPQGKDMNLLARFSTNSAALSGLHNSRINGIKLKGLYELKGEKDRLVISDFSGNGETGNFTGSLSISDLENPAVVLDLKSDLALSEWLILLPMDTIHQPRGRAVVDLHLENRFKSLRDIQPEELKRTKARGTFKLQEISFQFKDSHKKIESLSGDLAFTNDHLKVHSFYFQTGHSDIHLSGYFGNVLNYIFFKDEKLLVDAQVKSEEIVMEDFLMSGTTGQKEYRLDFVNSLDLNLNMQVKEFFFHKFFAEDIKGDLDVHDGVISGKSISLLADEGSFYGDFQINTRPADQYDFSASMNCTGINIHEFFTSFNDFGQEAISAENIYGKADLRLQMTSHIRHNLNIDPASVNLTAHLSIRNGNLKNYEPMLALSDFARIDELKDVRFDHLENDISIRNSVIYIPEMNVHNNVLDMGISGKHRFDNSIDYSLKLKLSDVLFRQRSLKKQNSEFDQHLAEAEGRDDPNIYIKMTGNASEPVINLDRENLKRSIREDIRKEGRELKNIFSKKQEPKDKKTGSGLEFDLFGEGE